VTLDAEAICALLLSVAMAIAAGLVGCFAAMRKMTLAADALSHVALPGIGVALALRIHPLLGATAALVLGALVVWALESRTRMATETIVGVLFSAALAVGAMMASGEDLLDALLGGARARFGLAETIPALACAIAIVVYVARAKSRLVVTMVSTDIAHTSGVKTRRVELGYLLVLALTVALGLRYLGVLLMGSLIIIPAATAKRVARSLREMFGVAVAVAVVSTLGGTWAGTALGRDTGPLIIVLAAACFFVSLVLRRR
jgi:ABC-type Mn2+/Zn2+ transport system permease subunit